MLFAVGVSLQKREALQTRVFVDCIPEPIQDERPPIKPVNLAQQEWWLVKGIYELGD
jgi:hypothetical protein